MIRRFLKSYRRGVKSLEWRRRLATANFRDLPSFVVLGAQKAGTTSLRGYLKRHPYVKMSFRKEVRYFDQFHREGLSWYRAQFPLAATRRREVAVGESTPYYLVYPHAPRRMHALIPNAKLIVLLRNPKERAISHYYHEVRKKREPLALMEALLAEEDRIASGWKRMQQDESYLSDEHRRYSYKQRGIYADQLLRYLKYYDRDSLLLISSEKLFTEPEVAIKEISDFIGVPSHIGGVEFLRRNAGADKDVISSEVTEYLDDYYLQHNNRLYEIAGQNFGWNDK